MSQKYVPRVATGTESNELNLVLQIRAIVELALGDLLLYITSSSFHFFNETDFEEYLFKHFYDKVDYFGPV